MALEPSFDFLDQLVPANPAFNDPVPEGDDHLRGIKNAIKANVTGNATETRLLSSGIVALSTNAAGGSVHDTFGADPILGWRDDANVLLGQVQHSSGLFSVRNLTHGANVQLQGEDTGGTLRNLFTGNPDGIAQMFHAGVTAIATEADGGTIQDTAGTNPLLRLRSSVGTELARVFGSASGARMRSMVHGGNVLIEGEDSGGVVRALLAGSPDGSASLYHNGLLAATTSADGFQVRDPVGNLPILELRNDAGALYGQFLSDGAATSLRSVIHGGELRMQSEDLGGTLRNILVGDPDAAVSMYYAGVLAAQTTSAGFTVLDETLDLNNSAANIGTRLLVRNSIGGLLLGIDAGSGQLSLFQTTSGTATEDAWITAARNGGVSLYYNGNEVVATKSTGVTITGTNVDLQASAASNTDIQARNTIGGLRARVDTAGDVRLYQLSAGGSNQDTWLRMVRNGAVSLWHNNTETLRTRSHTSGQNTSGSQTIDHDGAWYDVGFNLMPPVEADASQTFDEADVSKMIHKDSGGAVTYTLASGTSGAVPPIGSTIQIANEDTEAITIAAAGTLRWFNGSGTPPTGNRSLAHGGVCTVYKYASSEWWVLGGVGVS